MTYRHGATIQIVLAAVFALGQASCANPAMVKQTGQTLTSRSNPSLVLRINRLFKPIQPLAFPIESLTNVDRRVFVDCDDTATVRRLVIVQFETVQHGSTFRFLYPPRPPAALGNQTYRFSAYVHDDQAEAAKYPAKEAALTRNLLVSKGYKVPRLFRVARLARVADQGGMSEVIIFYMENADGQFSAGPLSGADEDGDLNLDLSAAQAMLTRLKSVVVPIFE